MLDDRDLRVVDEAVTVACAGGGAHHLHLLGHGEISIVLGWPPGAPRVAVKRLPPFPDHRSFDAYADVVGGYVAQLRGAGVRVLPTEVRRIDRPDGRVAGFHLQPVVDPACIGTEVLRATSPAPGHGLVTEVVAAVVRATTGGVGVDAQLANWAVLDGMPTQLDLTTPFLLDGRGRLAFDMDPFLASLPAVARGPVRREMQHLVRRWLTARGSLLDLVANLWKESLDGWVAPVLEAVNAAVSPGITPSEALRTHRSDRRLWPLLLQLQKGERWWRTAVRRQPYEFLLPARTTYAAGENATPLSRGP